MGKNLITKKILGDALKELMKKYPFEKISVQDIVDACGLTRQTFYYHFKDKYDLVNWIYFYEAVQNLSCYNFQSWEENFYRVLVHLDNNRSFYLKALNIEGQNSFAGYLYEMSYEMVRRGVEDAAYMFEVGEEDKKFITEFYTHALVGITLNWLKREKPESPEVVVCRVKMLLEGSVRKALLNYQRLQK